MDSYIYFAKNSLGQIKIGVSKDPQSRVATLRTADPGYSIIATCPGGAELERALHNRFSNLRVDGEIFIYGEEIQAYIASINSSSDIVMETYYYTTDLGKFKIDENENRAVSSNHVAKIKNSIASVGVRRELPIIVRRDSGKLVIVDGQHRFVAVRELKNSGEIPNIGIWYIIADQNWTHKVTAITNDTQESWSLTEYFNLYVKQGKKEYVKLKQFMDDHEIIPLTVALALSQGADRTKAGFLAGNSDVGQDIKSGEFVFLDNVYAEFMGKAILDVNSSFSTRREVSRMSRFAQTALISFINADKITKAEDALVPVEYDHARMLDQLDKYAFLIEKQRTIDDWKTLFVEIYNYKRKDPIMVSKF